MTRSRILWVCAAVVLLSVGVASSGLWAQQANQKLDERTDAIAAEVSRLRGLSIDRPIERGVMNKSQIRKRLVARMAEEYTPEELAAEALALERLGLLPVGTDYQKMVLDLLADQIAGFYDPWERRLYIADWPMVGKEIAMAHEIDHALQDQHFDLEKFMTADKKDGDATVARQALVEGDGTALMLEYVYQTSGLKGSPWADDKMVQMLTSTMNLTSGGDMLSKVPLYLREELIFPYTAGLGFVAHFRKLSPWQRIDRMFKKPPRSTEQIMHPAKYEQDERPIAITTRPLAALAGYHQVYDNVMGELGLSLFLRQNQVSAQRAAIAAAGWGGDRLAVYQPPGYRSGVAGVVAVHQAVFDQEVDAIEYFEALGDGLEVLAGTEPRRRDPTAIELVTKAGEAMVAERRRDTVVMVIAGADRAAKIRDQVWKSWKTKRRR